MTIRHRGPSYQKDGRWNDAQAWIAVSLVITSFERHDMKC